MKTIRVGDKVQAFLDPNIYGTVEEILSESSGTWLVGGTSTVELYCVLVLEDGSKVKCKMSELRPTYE
jgi:hypothetical protein